MGSQNEHESLFTPSHNISNRALLTMELPLQPLPQYLCSHISAEPSASLAQPLSSEMPCLDSWKMPWFLVFMLEAHHDLLAESFNFFFWFPSFQLFNNMSNNVSLMYLLRGPGVDEFPEIGLFSIEDNQSGKIYVHRAVDREVTPSFLVPKMDPV